MRIDVHHPDGLIRRDAFEDRIGDRMIAAGGNRLDAGRMDFTVELLDIVVLLLEIEAVRERHIAQVRDPAQFIRIDRRAPD